MQYYIDLKNAVKLFDLPFDIRPRGWLHQNLKFAEIPFR